MRTGWYSGKQFPLREGWYERDYSNAEGFYEHGGQTIFRDLWLQTRPGNGHWYVDEPNRQINDAWWGNLPWRRTEIGKTHTPAFEEWVMGWPVQWTELTQSAMGRFRRWLLRHGGF